MPKISKQYASFRIAAQSIHFDYDVMYSSKKEYFYVLIPDRFLETVKLLSDEQKSELKITTYHENSKKQYPVFHYSKEQDIINRMNGSFKYLAELGVTTRQVILIWFHGEVQARSNSEKPTNSQHPLLNLGYGIFYTTETKVNGGKPDYGKTLGYRGEENVLILDDTPENRAFLELTYKMFLDLKEKMGSFFGDKEALLGLITSGQHLIG